MERKERLELYNKCVEKWGYIAQLDQCVEEMAELTVAINKIKRKRNGEYQNDNSIEENFIEEVCDVFFSIEQFIDWIGEEKFNSSMNAKLEKLKKALKNNP